MTKGDADDEIGHRASSVEVFFTPEFRRNVRRLSKRYPHLRADVQPTIDQLQQGQRPGEQIPRIGYPVFKLRVPNRDAAKGKRGGYRIIYYLQTPTAIILITIYSKSEQGDVTASDIRQIVADFERAGKGSAQ